MTRRTHRVGEAMREALGEVMQRYMKDPRIGFVTVTAVRVTPDLGKAHVYYTVLGDSEQQEATQQGLESAAPFLRGEVGRRVRLKTLPELVFHFDDAVQHGARVDELLKEIHGEHAETAEPGADSTDVGSRDRDDADDLGAHAGQDEEEA